jgi:peptidoglycan hydrolase-like protein with peptidoglycan-binding domain
LNMETLAYLQVAQDFESPEAKELTCVQSGRDLIQSFSESKLPGQLAALAIGAACSTVAVGVAGAAQALTLYQGDSGPDVTYLQNLLANAGYFSGSATGYYGSYTADAVANYQASQGLVADGVAGSATFGALEGFQPVRPGGVLSYGDSGAGVSDLQRLLSNAGYFVPQTGYFGSATENALIAFQRDYGLVADGLAGPATLDALSYQAVRPEEGGVILQYGDSGSGVAGLQQQLINRGFLAPGLATGYFGSSTEAALIAYQRASGLVADGIFGPSTAASFV